MKENHFTLKKKKKARSRQYAAETVTDADYVDDLALLANTPVQTESLLHSLEKSAKGIGLCVNSDKTESIYFNQDSTIFSLNGKPLKLVN